MAATAAEVVLFPTGLSLGAELTSVAIFIGASVLLYFTASILWGADTKAASKGADQQLTSTQKKMGTATSSGVAAAASVGASSTEKMVMALFVRQDLKMGTGKSAAQCAHAAVASTEQCMEAGPSSEWPSWLESWRRAGSSMITYKVTTEDDLKRIASGAKASKLPCYLVRDAGRTQIAAGSRTVTSVGPAPESMVAALAEGCQKL